MVHKHLLFDSIIDKRAKILFRVPVMQILRYTYLSENDWILGTNGGGPDLVALDSVVVFRETPGIDGNFGLKFFSVVEDSAPAPSLLYPGGKNAEISSTSDGRLSKKDSMGNLELSGFFLLLLLDGELLVEDDSVPDPSLFALSLYPGGKN